MSASFTELIHGDPNDYICEDIPDANVSVNENYEAESGTANFISTFIDDDNDGVPNDSRI